MDNLGAFWSTFKGHSRDRYCYSITNAIVEVALGLGIQWKVEFLPRRVGLGPCVADELSKGRVQQALWLLREAGIENSLNFTNLSRTFLNFIAGPGPTRVLGSAILQELGRYIDVAPVSPEWSEEVSEFVVHSYCDLEMYWYELLGSNVVDLEWAQIGSLDWWERANLSWVPNQGQTWQCSSHYGVWVLSPEYPSKLVTLSGRICETSDILFNLACVQGLPAYFLSCVCLGPEDGTGFRKYKANVIFCSKFVGKVL